MEMAARPASVGRLIVVGGQSSGVGKTALIEDILRATGEMEWTAAKVTPHLSSVPEGNTPSKRRRQDGGGMKKGERGPEGRGALGAGDTKSGLGCGEVSIRDEGNRDGRSDTSRFLAAGARRAIWVECGADKVSEAVRALKKELAGSGNVIIESGSVIEHWKPDLFLMVLDPREDDFKESARRFASKADVFVYRSPFQDGKGQEGLIRAAARRKKVCRIVQPLGQPLPLELREIVRQPRGRK